MRMLLFFDLPVVTSAHRKAYSKFRKFLIDEGWLMMQYSVYSKLALNNTQAQTTQRRLEQNKPEEGSIVVLKVTEKQFAAMAYVLGEKNTSPANSDARVVFLGKDPRNDKP